MKFGELQSSGLEDSRRPFGSGLVGCRGAGVPGGGQATGRCPLRIQRFLLDTLAKESQDHKALTLPPPKRPAPALTTLVSPKKPKQNPQPTGRGRVKFKGKGHFSGQSAHRVKGRGANKGRNVPDVRTPACMKAPEVPPLTVRLRSNHRENSREAIKILGGLGPR